MYWRKQIVISYTLIPQHSLKISDMSDITASISHLINSNLVSDIVAADLKIAAVGPIL